MDNYICKIATREEIIKRWDYLISIHTNDDSWKGYKKRTLDYFDQGTMIQYFGILEGKIICECCAHIDKNITYIKDSKDLITDDMAYLNAFRCDKEYKAKGYFSELFNFMIEDLKNRGFSRASLGVEPCEVRNIQIYFHWGFTNFIKTGYDEYLPAHEGDEPINVCVNYYWKQL